MSAYGAIARPQRNGSLPPLLLPSHAPNIEATLQAQPLAIYHLTSTDAPVALIELLWKEFTDEVDRGTTYPQEGPMSLEAFIGYFFAADVFVGLSVTGLSPGAQPPVSITEAKGDRTWDDCVLGFYYVRCVCHCMLMCRPNFINSDQAKLSWSLVSRKPTIFSQCNCILLLA
jgi:hypothetical protein